MPSLIFDEVDTGIGGRVAEIVGQKLRALALGRQVFCVTHLPQVAVQGHRHLLVEKVNADGITRSSVRKLSREDRKREIARMLGGIRVTEQTLAHAEEMLDSHLQSELSVVRSNFGQEFDLSSGKRRPSTGLSWPLTLSSGHARLGLRGEQSTHASEHEV